MRATGWIAVGAAATTAAHLIFQAVGVSADEVSALASLLALGVQGLETLVLGACAGFILALPMACIHIHRRRGKVAFGPWLLGGVLRGLIWAALNGL